MIEQSQRAHDADLPEFLAARARGASDLRLVADTMIGLIAVFAAIVWPFPYSLFVLTAGGCLLGFGVWGIADRELAERGSSATGAQTRWLRLAKRVATAVGATSAAVLAVRFMALLIGRVIS